MFVSQFYELKTKTFIPIGFIVSLFYPCFRSKTLKNKLEALNTSVE